MVTRLYVPGAPSIGAITNTLRGGGGAFISLSANALPENSAAGTAIGTLSVSGATGTAVFTLTDSAGSKVQVAGTNGVNLQAGATASNYETATSYSIIVHVTGTTPAIADTTFTIGVTDVNEFTPVITSNGGGSTATVSIAENTTAVTTVTATDGDGSAVIAYSISGGADAAKFTINSTTGVLAFATAPDYETPTDLGATAGNNTYVVIVQASVGTNTDTQTITVTVTDVADTGGGTAGQPLGLLLALTKAA
jgi:hypothetical protein